MISKESLGITVRNGQLRKNGRLVNVAKVASEIIQVNRNMSLSQAEELCQQWLESEEALTDTNDFVEKSILNSTILDNFCIILNSIPGQNVPVLFFREENCLQFLCTLPASLKEFTHVLRTYKPKEFNELRDAIATHLRPKLSVTLDDETICTAILNASKFYTNEKYIYHLDSPLKPITLNNQSLAKVNINFTYKENPKLNPLLSEFLGRVDFPKQLCAILWLMFNGIKTPYLVYLYGDGGNGKSSFIRMLAEMVQHTSAIELDGLFKYYHMYGKALLTLTENTDNFLMQHKMIKEITGGSIVSCQEKGKKSFSATIDGLLMVDSNSKLKLIGEEYEYRRLRYFEIKTPKGIEKLSSEEYIKELGSSPDDFLSYCKQCYEEVGHNNLVEPAPEQLKKTIGLVDSYYTHKYTKAISAMGLHYSKNAKMPVGDFFDIFEQKVRSKNPDKYFLDNLRTYLRVHHEVVEYDGFFNGISSQPPVNVERLFTNESEN